MAVFLLLANFRQPMGASYLVQSNPLSPLHSYLSPNNVIPIYLAGMPPNGFPILTISCPRYIRRHAHRIYQAHFRPSGAYLQPRLPSSPYPSLPCPSSLCPSYPHPFPTPTPSLTPPIPYPRPPEKRRQYPWRYPTPSKRRRKPPPTGVSR